MTDVRRRPDAELLTVGLDLALRLRDGDDRAALHRSLLSLRVGDMRELAICLAACIDPDVAARDLLAWCGGRVPEAAPPRPRLLRPCGTEAAWVRHKARDEKCETCAAAMRVIWKAKKARQRRQGRTWTW